MIASDYASQNYMNVYGANATYSTTNVKANVSYFETTGDLSGSKYAKGADSADISSQVQEMMNRVKNLDVFSCIFNDNSNPYKGTKSLSDLESDFMSDFQSFAGAFGAYGSSGSGSTTFGLDGQGGMTVNGSGSSSSSNYLTGSTATSRFALMAARAAMVDAGYTLDGFSDSYSENPYAAIENNIDALKERFLGFRVVAENGTVQYGFERNAEIEYSETTATYDQTAAVA